MDVTWSELNNARLLSPKLWKGFARPTFGRVSADQSGNPAIGMFDDFTGFSGLLSTSDGMYTSEGNTYRSYQTATNVISNVALTTTPASVGPTSIGAISIGSTAAIDDNTVLTLVHGGNMGTPYGTFPYNVIPKMSGDLVFEARFKVSSVAASAGNFFIGLGGAATVDTCSADCPIAADVLATTLSMIGLGRFGSSTTAMGLFYERAGGTVATVAAVGTLAADTYIKGGFRWDSRTQIVTPYIDGEPVAAAKRTTKAIAAATPWPDDYMTPIVGVRNISASVDMRLTLDWWACAQYLYL